jgi:hypothetical protein
VAGFPGKPYGVYIYRFHGAKWNREILDKGSVSAASCAAADLDEDGKPEIACIGQATHNLVQWVLALYNRRESRFRDQFTLVKAFGPRCPRITNGMSAASARQQLEYKRRTEEDPVEIHTIGIDLGKTVFHLVGLNVRGEVVMRKTCSRAQLLRFTANRQVNLIVM